MTVYSEAVAVVVGLLVALGTAEGDEWTDCPVSNCSYTIDTDYVIDLANTTG